ncbi:MAG: tRNA lysidine(34) synthetase TilS [Nitrospirae bacterium]|nr:MAG: tRNA lysidine(34) synthetase TilS [Nitrospirota bacterium]
MDTLRDRALHPVLRQVAEAARRKRLIQPGDRVLVAVSGGPDSVCLLMALHEMRERSLAPGTELRIAHVNYGLRGEESEGDETFVRELGRRLDVPVSCERVRPIPQSGGTLQSRARDARYAFFERMLREHRMTAVATGHTADDQAETVLLWLMRGAGTRGLAGIPVKREGDVIRPLLGVTRQQVLDYLASRGMPYRSDSSNGTPVYRRNRIRQEILPALRALNPRIVEALARGADILSADAVVLHEIEQERWRAIAKDASPGHVVLDADRLAAEPLGLQRRLVRRALAAARGGGEGLTFRHVSDILERVLKGTRGAGLNLPGGLRVERDRDRIVMAYSARQEANVFLTQLAAGIPLPVPGEARIGGGLRLLTVEGKHGSPDGRTAFAVDSDRLGGPLTVRTWRRGDWFCPFGMGGRRKKLQDFFVDRKVDRKLRGVIPLVVAPAGIVWVAGYRGDERFAAGPATVHPVTLSIAPPVVMEDDD